MKDEEILLSSVKLGDVCVTHGHVVCICIVVVGETNNIVCMRQERIICLLNSSYDGANTTSLTDGVVGGSHLS